MVEKYCYHVSHDREVERAIEYALNSKNPKDLQITREEFDSWIGGDSLLPISVLERACEINKNNLFVPVKYQFKWFCLHGVQIQRKQPSGRIIKPTVKFAPVYVEKKEELLQFLEKAIDVYGSKKLFSELIHRKRKSMNHWLNRKCSKKPPITAYLKAAQILNENVWDVLDGTKLFNINSKDFVTFKKKYPRGVDELLIWIVGDGNISINRNSIHIRQAKDGLSVLETLSQKFTEIFSIPPHHLSIKENGKDDFFLHIYSKPLAQILVLYFGIPLGYKVYSDPPFNLFSYESRKEGIRKLTRHLETEGTFSYVRKTFAPIVAIGTRDETRAELILEMWRDLGYHSYLHDELRNGVKMYIVKLYRRKEVLKLCHEILPHLWHLGKVRDVKELMNVLTQD